MNFDNSQTTIDIYRLGEVIDFCREKISSSPSTKNITFEYAVILLYRIT